jgi:hypothetical protein
MRSALLQLRGKLRALAQVHQEFFLVLVLAVAFRAMAVLVFRPGGYLGELSDFGYYRLLLGFANQGFYPLFDFWLEYPPLFPWLALGLYRLSLWIPAWSQPGTWFYLLLGAFLTLVEAGNLILLYALARRLHGQAQAVRLAWVYTALLVPVLVLLGGFDSLALFFLLLAVLLTLQRRPISTGVAAGLGFMTKLVPIAALPAAWQALRGRSQRARLAAATVVTLLLIALPFLWAGPAFLFQSLKSPVIRSTWETVWALIDGYYSYGIAGGVDRFDPAMAGAAQHPTRLPWLAITLGFGLFYLYLFTRRVDWSDARRVVAFTALTQNLLTLYFKGYSPQFLVMLLPFVILLLPGWRGLTYALLLSAANLIEYPIYFLVLPDQPWLLAGTVLSRTLILVIVSVEYAAQVYEWRASEGLWRRIAVGITALLLLLGGVGAVLGFRAFVQSSYASSPHRPALELLAREAAPEALVVTAELWTYEQIYPLVHRAWKARGLDLHLVETYDYLPPWEPRLDELARRASGQVWVYAAQDSPLHDWLAARYAPLASYDLNDQRLSGWDTR